MTQIYTPTAEEIERRISRFHKLREMTTRDQELKDVSPDAVDVIFARKIMPVILDQTKSPFGSYAPILRRSAHHHVHLHHAARPGAVPALAQRGPTRLSWCWRGGIEYSIGDPVVHCFTLEQVGCVLLPAAGLRGFRNVGKGDAVQLTVITGVEEGRDDVSIPDSVAQQVRREHGTDALDTMKRVSGSIRLERAPRSRPASPGRIPLDSPSSFAKRPRSTTVLPSSSTVQSRIGKSKWQAVKRRAVSLAPVEKRKLPAKARSSVPLMSPAVVHRQRIPARASRFMPQPTCDVA